MMIPYSANRALELLRVGCGQPDASFRDGQEEAIRHVVEGLGRLLVVQRTGWGKSFVYFIAIKLLREAGRGPALLVSPLLSLMRNQIAAAERMGARAATIHSDNQDAWSAIEVAVRQDEVDVLLISPERFANERFQEEVLAGLSETLSLLVVDEAHCISDWGHDFRPHYRRLERIVRALPPNLRLLGTTATANDRVLEDLRSVLGPGLAVTRGELHRPSLALQTLRLPDKAQRLGWLAERLPHFQGSGIVYSLTKRDTEQVAEWLRSQGIVAEAYTGETGDRREGLEQALLANRLKVLVATTALGMGFDKPDLAFVIHYQTPGSVVAYYQQVGRAGRALDAAYGILLSGAEETDVTGWFIESAFPTEEQAQRVLQALEQAPAGLSVPQLLGRVNLSMGRIERTLTLLSLEAPAAVVKQGSKWQLTAAPVNPAFWARARRLTEVRRLEQQEMQRYVSLTSGHMEFLIRALDGDPAGISAPPLPPLSAEVAPHLLEAATAFLRRSHLPIEPRKRWPVGGMPNLGQQGAISPELRAEPGKSLCILGDAGWGTLIEKGKYQAGRFTEPLVEACARLVEAWDPQPAPTWVACVPSLRHPDLVPDFAQRLAARLDLPFHAMLVKTENRPEQQTMANSAQQAKNVDGSLALGRTKPLSEPVLLVDDIVDSRWTLTVAAWILRRQGSGEVFPLALADAGS